MTVDEIFPGNPHIRNEAHLDGSRCPIRDAFRDHCPWGRDGFTAEDMDGVVRFHGPNYNTDADGLFCFYEKKHGRAGLGWSKLRQMIMLDRMIRLSPEAHRYLGFYIIRVWQNGKSFSIDEEPQTYSPKELGDWFNGLPARVDAERQG